MAQPYRQDLDDGLYYDPVDAALPQDDTRVLFEATEQLVDECMDRVGAGYAPRDMPPWEYEVARWLSGYEVLGITSVEDAEENGYGLADGTPIDEQWHQAGGPDDGAWEAYEGTTVIQIPNPELPDLATTVPSNGCRSEALAELYGDLNAYAQLVSSTEFLSTLLAQRIASDPAYVAMSREWSSCMRGKGFNEFTEQFQGWQSVEGELTRDQPREGYEKEVAVADAECIEATDYRRRIDALHVQAKEQILDDHADDLTAFTELREEAVVRARETPGVNGA